MEETINRDIFSGESGVITFNSADCENVNTKPLERDVADSIASRQKIFGSTGCEILNYEYFLHRTGECIRKWSIEPSDRPHNLRYPNKKRALRIQKKWFNRYVAPKCVAIYMSADNDCVYYIPYAKPTFDVEGVHFECMDKPRKIKNY